MFRITISILMSVFIFLCFGCYKQSNGMVPENSVAMSISSSTIALVNKNDFFKDGEIDGIYRPYCSGVWVSERKILTAHHCIRNEVFTKSNGLPDETGMIVYFITESEVIGINEQPKNVYTGRILATDKKHDLAILTILSPDELIPRHYHAKLSEKTPSIGERVSMMGHPKGLYWTYVEGSVASYRNHINIGSETEGPFLQVSAPIYLGNSGGGAFNSNKELVGIASFIVGVPNTAFYIPLSVIKNFISINYNKN